MDNEQWILLKKYSNQLNGIHYINQHIELPYHTFDTHHVDIKFIYDSSVITTYNLNSSCFVDEIYLYGLQYETELIWNDHMDSGKGWYYEGTSEHYKRCYIGNCVEIKGNGYIEKNKLSTKNYKNKIFHSNSFIKN